MGRPREFDTERALDAAKLLFWEKGYADTSISDLEEHLGVGRQSIYGAFGDKHALFVKTLERYADEQLGHRELLWRDGAGLAEIRDFVNGVLAFISPGAGRSCFLVNTALATDGDPQAEAYASRNLDHLTRSFANALRGAASRGEIAPTTDIEGTALLLASHVFGLNVMARSGASIKTLERAAEAALATLG